MFADKCSQATRPPHWFQPAELRLLRCRLYPRLPRMKSAAGKVLPPLTRNLTGHKTDQGPVSVHRFQSCTVLYRKVASITHLEQWFHTVLPFHTNYLNVLNQERNGNSQGLLIRRWLNRVGYHGRSVQGVFGSITNHNHGKQHVFNVAIS